MTPRARRAVHRLRRGLRDVACALTGHRWHIPDPATNPWAALYCHRCTFTPIPSRNPWPT